MQLLCKIAAAIAVIFGFGFLTVTAALAQGPDTCQQGYVWREAFPGDQVCVPPATRTQAALDNGQAAARRQPGGGRYGPDTCRQGYVWREAGPNDHVCVTPETRDRAAVDNRQAGARRASADRWCVVYEHRDFGGRSLRIGQRPVTFGTGTEGDSNWNSVSGWNDRISSMQFPAGCQMVTWEHELGRGRSHVWNKGQVRFVGDQWNDRISSVECRC